MIPYQIWHGHKPNISNLQEFSPLVQVLLQGQKVQQKALLKLESQRRTYVDFDAELKSINTIMPLLGTHTPQEIMRSPPGHQRKSQ